MLAAEFADHERATLYEHESAELADDIVIPSPSQPVSSDVMSINEVTSVIPVVFIRRPIGAGVVDDRVAPQPAVISAAVGAVALGLVARWDLRRW